MVIQISYDLGLMNRFLNYEESFLTEEETSRYSDICINEKLYAGEQAEVYLSAFLQRLELSGLKIKQGDSYLSYSSQVVQDKYKNVLQSVNIIKPIIDTYAGLLFGNGINITSEDEMQNKWLNGDKESGKKGFVQYLAPILHKGAIGAGIRGNAVFELYKDYDGVVRVAVKPSKYWLPICSEKDRTNIIADAICEQYHIKDKLYINRVVIYAKGYNIYFAVAVEEGKTKRLVPYNEKVLGKLPDGIKKILDEEIEENTVFVEETGLDYSLISTVANEVRDDRVFGIPLITESTRTQEREMCIRATQEGRILDKNSDPILAGPDSFLNQNEDGNYMVEAAGKFMGIAPDELAPQFITWDGNLDANREAIKSSLSNILRECRMNEAVLGASVESISVLSGVAMERVFMSTLNALGTKKMLWSNTIDNILRAAYQLETGKNDLQFTMMFAEGLPKSSKEKIDETVVAVNGMVKSKLDAIMELYPGISREDAEATLEQIMREQQGEVPINNELTI